MKQNDEASRAADILPCDRRYRNSHYFLKDQIRCSEALADFRAIREWLSRAASFSLYKSPALRTAPVPVAVRTQKNAGSGQ